MEWKKSIKIEFFFYYRVLIVSILTDFSCFLNFMFVFSVYIICCQESFCF